MGLPIDPPERFRWMNGLVDQSSGIHSSVRVGAYGILPATIL